MSVQVSITKGFYRGMPVTGVFKLVKAYKEGARGGFITVHNPDPQLGHPPVQRITVEKGDFKLMDATGNELGEHVVVDNSEAGGSVVATTDYETAFMSDETDDEAMDRIEETFLMLDKIVDACAQGVVRGLVVAGPPGIGKSFGVEKQLDVANLFRTMEGKNPNYEIVSGAVSPIGLYQKLYYNRKKDQVLVFDDADGILFEEESLNLLKAALNSGDRRRICWNKESRTLQVDDIPDSFDFEGSVIFLTNIDFEKTIAKGSRVGAHLGAIMSRCHYLDLEIGSLRDKILRIRQIIRGGMLKNYEFKNGEEDLIQDFIVNNAEYLREVSLRMVKKVADFVKADPAGWEEMAESTCLQREAKFKRLLEKKQAVASKKGAVLVNA